MKSSASATVVPAKALRPSNSGAKKATDPLWEELQKQLTEKQMPLVMPLVQKLVMAATEKERQEKADAILKLDGANNHIRYRETQLKAERRKCKVLKAENQRLKAQLGEQRQARALERPIKTEPKDEPQLPTAPAVDPPKQEWD